jgi:hypothetical protein
VSTEIPGGIAFSRGILFTIHLLTFAQASISRASHHLSMVLALLWSVVMVSIPSREVIKEAARNMEASKPFCTRTSLMSWLAEGEPAPLTKKDAPLEWTVLLAYVVHLLSVHWSDASKQTTSHHWLAAGGRVAQEGWRRVESTGLQWGAT